MENVMKRTATSIISIVMILVGPAICMGILAQLNLNQVVTQSDLIIIGRVVELREPNESNSGEAVVEIHQTIKGTDTLKTVIVRYSGNIGSTISEDATFKLNAEYLIFLRNFDSRRFTVVLGYGGLLHIGNGRLTVDYIKDCNGTWLVPVFIRQINKVISTPY
jgi:hypothetical protein